MVNLRTLIMKMLEKSFRLLKNYNENKVYKNYIKKNIDIMGF